MPRTKITPNAGNGILIHTSCPIPYGELGSEPRPPIEKNGYSLNDRAQALTAHTFSRTARIDRATEIGWEA